MRWVSLLELWLFRRREGFAHRVPGHRGASAPSVFAAESAIGVESQHVSNSPGVPIRPIPLSRDDISSVGPDAATECCVEGAWF